MINENKTSIDIGISVKTIFNELCLECKNKNFLWNSSACIGCVNNQVDMGNMRKFRKAYPEHRRKVR